MRGECCKYHSFDSVFGAFFLASVAFFALIRELAVLSADGFSITPSFNFPNSEASFLIKLGFEAINCSNFCSSFFSGVIFSMSIPYYKSF